MPKPIDFNESTKILQGDKPHRAALYIRLSKEDDRVNESQSVTNQRAMLRAYAEAHDLFVYDEYVDDGYSGGNYDRPAFTRLLADIEAKKINVVLTKDAYVTLRQTAALIILNSKKPPRRRVLQNIVALERFI